MLENQERIDRKSKENRETVNVIFSRTNTLIPATVQIKAIGGTVDKGDDYRRSVFPLNLSYEAGEDKQKAAIPIKQDRRVEKTETILLKLKVVENVEVGKRSGAKVRIINSQL